MAIQLVSCTRRDYELPPAIVVASAIILRNFDQPSELAVDSQLQIHRASICPTADVSNNRVGGVIGIWES